MGKKIYHIADHYYQNYFQNSDYSRDREQILREQCNSPLKTPLFPGKQACTQSITMSLHIEASTLNTLSNSRKRKSASGASASVFLPGDKDGSRYIFKLPYFNVTIVMPFGKSL